MKISRKSIIATSGAGLLIVSGALFLRWSNAPVSTTQSNVNNGAVLSSQISLKPYESTYFTTLIPETYILKSSNENAQNAIRGSYLFKDSTASNSDQIGITIGRIAGDSLPNIPPVKLRTSKPTEYVPATIPSMPTGAIAFEQVDKYEKSVFWVKDRNYVAVVVSGSPQRAAQLDQALQAMLANWQ